MSALVKLCILGLATLLLIEGEKKKVDDSPLPEELENGTKEPNSETVK